MDQVSLPNIPNNLTDDEKRLILKKGTVLNIKHPRVFEGMLNVIQKADNNTIYLKLTEPFLKDSILIGDRVRCQILSTEFEYTIYGEISNIDITSPGYVKINILRAFKYQNIRKDKRYLVNFRANIYAENIDKPIYGVVKNISSSGMAVVSNEYLEKLSELRLKFSININKNEFIELTAKVIRDTSSTGYFEYGLLITHMDDSNKNSLKKLLDSLENDEKAFLDI
ncbi:MAG: PilZ domain-containing protein [Bacillota bacterium]